MTTIPIGPLSSLSNLTPTQTVSSTSSGPGFAQYLAQSLDKANTLSTTADQMSASYAAGGPVSVDQLMVAEQQASLAVDLVVQVRNRAVSAYQSIMNMQV